MADAVTADGSVDTTEADAAQGVYHFLDVGGTKYGECTLVVFGKLRILIDGSHREDFRGQRGYSSIPAQLEKILGAPAPHAIDLVVVTHCHADHVGCLPELVANDVIKPAFALLTDPKAGFGREAGTDAPSMDAMSSADRLAALLREEDASDLDDGELAAFIDAVATVEARYNQFVEDLEQKGVKIVFHRGGALDDEIAERLKPTGIRLLGPSPSQILRCAEQIATTNDEADGLAARLRSSDTMGIIDLYRSIVGSPADPVGRNPRGNGMNCQSICLAFGPPGARALLAGDMQFTDPGVRQIEEEMEALRRAVVDAGPYVLFKTTHHTSHNGQDDLFLDDIGNPRFLVHSGGLHDEKHPYPGLLTRLKRREGIVFARTDRNGHIEVRPKTASNPVRVSRGALNDFSPNLERDVPARENEPAPWAARKAAPSPSQPVAAIAEGQGPQIIIVNLPPGPIDMSVAGVDIVVRPAGASASAPFAYQPVGTHGVGGASRPLADGQMVAPGRSITGLLFVTDPVRLAANIGRGEADRVLAEVEQRGGMLVLGTGDRLIDLARAQLRKAPQAQGVVLLGGYDVVPSVRRDVLSNDLRRKLGGQAIEDADNFWVWSDSSYADVDGDAIAEFPVSRVPDARDAGLFLNALAASPLRRLEKFGIRNLARPFAAEIWSEVIGTREIEVCETFGPERLEAGMLQSACHYYMLHGADDDGSLFTGEDANGTGYPEAFLAASVPPRFDGIVFSGCCWGALIVDEKAYGAVTFPAPRLAERSIALSYLKAGALAFVGCTGAHYSGPSIDPDRNYAMRLHQAFWSHLKADNISPALALFRARGDFAQTIVGSGHDLDPLGTARRLKNLEQFTCLGLGW
ncbi:hypothetical protein BWQ93_03245 [Sphingopyxis sp. QXT-31]|uniref:MBL fold metallo-hydrolase n=1 Tax=Sphingopyxis sp. QXT-31 TaxID=1357916 RepID=UPI00097924A7|nr:MBL fold metallo-hydrolase [Sphingopyxis sp. QXT-31]APZ97609.1 hypothetical protein BWQ93_03245 [Sphingopyxis sp. QXT-31]